MSEAGLRAGRYVLRRRLGTGGMAEVWLAETTGPAGFHKRVVVKAILPHLASDPEFVRLFLSEARLSARLNHPNVVQVYELFTEKDQYFSVMELVDGGSLRQLMRAAKTAGQLLPAAVVAHVLLDACQGLGYVHALNDDDGKPLGVVHRDISPDNILLNRSGIAKVADFGIARASNSTSYTRPGSVRGKLSYIAPEVYQGVPADARSDLYALGVVGYEALTGQQPFRAATEAETINRVMQGVVTPLRELRPDVPVEVEAAIASAMHADREKRFVDAAAFARALEILTSTTAAVALGTMVHELIPPLPPLPAETLPPLTEDVALSGVSSADTFVPVAVTVSSSRPFRAALAGAIAVFVGMALAIGVWKVSRPSGVEPGLVTSGSTPLGDSKIVPAADAVDAGAVVENTAPVKPLGGDVPDAGVAATAAVVTPSAHDAGTVTVATAPPSTGRKKRGTLVVRAYPWADVMVDSTPAGQTPIKPMQLDVGTHKVTLVNSSLSVTRTVQTQVRSGKVTTVEQDLSKP